MRKYSRTANVDGIKNYFCLPNAIFCLGLSYGEIAMYAYLLYLENRITYQCYPSYKTIGNAIGMSVNTVRKYVNSLVEKKLITVEQTKVRLQNGRVRNGNLLYNIRLIGEAVDYFNSQQFRKVESEAARYDAQQKLHKYDQKHIKPGDLWSSLFEAG